MTNQGMEKLDADIVIIGAGLSGLSAAFYLQKKDKGLRILVVEAKERIGGRLQSMQLKAMDGGADYWDLGGEWVGRPQPHLNYLLKKFKIETFNPIIPKGHGEACKEPSLSYVTRLDLHLFTIKINRLKKKFDKIDLHSSVEALMFDGITLEDYATQNLWTPGAKAVVMAASRCMFGFGADEMSMLFFMMHIASAGGINVFTTPSEFTGKESRVKGGLSQLPVHLLTRIGQKNLLLKNPVTNISQSDSKVIVITTQVQIRCQRVILAIPPHHIAAINYSPPLPSQMTTLLRSIPLAYTVKFVYTYQRPFWNANGPGSRQFGFQSELTDPDHGPVGVVYDGTSTKGNPALSGFLYYAKGKPGSEEDPEEQVDSILFYIEQLLGPEVREYIDCQTKDWSQEPYNGGCFLTNILPGTTTYFNQSLREPINRIHFAGAETATVWCNFMNGAVQAGFRAATEVLYHLRPQVITSPDPDKQIFDEEVSLDSNVSTKVIIYASVGLGLMGVLVYVLKNPRLFKIYTSLK